MRGRRTAGRHRLRADARREFDKETFELMPG